MFCPNCGAPNPDTALTCEKCGFNVKGAAAPKFKGTMLMMNQQGGPAVPGVTPPMPMGAPVNPGVPGNPGGPAADAAAANSKLKGTMIGVAPPSAGAVVPPGGPGPTAPMAATPGGKPAINPLDSTMAAGAGAFGYGFPNQGAPAGPPGAGSTALGVAPPPAGTPSPGQFGGPSHPGMPGPTAGMAPPGAPGSYPPAGAPGAPAGFGGPPPGAPAGFGGPPPGAPPGFGGPPGGFGGPPPGAPPGFGGPPGGAPPGFGGPPPGQFGAGPMVAGAAAGAMMQHPPGAAPLAAPGYQPGMPAGAAPYTPPAQQAPAAGGEPVLQRSPVGVAVLTMVTCGIYAFFWYAGVSRWARARGADIPPLWWVLIPIMNLIWFWKFCKGLETASRGQMSAGTNLVLIWLLGFIGIAIVHSNIQKQP